MVSLKLSPFKASFTPLKKISARNTIRKQFGHVNCSDNEISQYFKDAAAARATMAELGQRSWEYQVEFADEMARRCRAMMGDNKQMHQALDVFEHWYLHLQAIVLMERLEKHTYSPIRRFPLLQEPMYLADLYPRAQRLVVSDEALEFALAFSSAMTQKKPLHRIAVDKSQPLGQDLLSQRQRALAKIVPEDMSFVELWDWEYTREGRMVRVPSRVHLEWLCWGYTPDERGIQECGARELVDKLNGVL
jgi:hypothetical protein